MATTRTGGTLTARAGASYRYSAHGLLEVNNETLGSPTVAGTDSEVGYTGSLRLSGGLLLMGARVYNPALKIWMQPDPIEPFKYDYADGDPINKIDPSGLLAQEATSDGGMQADGFQAGSSMSPNEEDPATDKDTDKIKCTPGKCEEITVTGPRRPDREATIRTFRDLQKMYSNMGPPPVKLPPGKNGKPNRWVPIPGTKERPVKWKPLYPVPTDKGGQPSASWDEPEGHWDYDDGEGNRSRYLPDGTPVSHRQLVCGTGCRAVLGGAAALGIIALIVATDGVAAPLVLAF